MKTLTSLFKRDLFIFGILLVAGLLVYANVIRGEFIWDDLALIVHNTHIQSLKNIFILFTENTLQGATQQGHAASDLYRPLQGVINTFIYAIFGLREEPYHLVSILIHILNSYLVFRVLGRVLKFTRGGSLFGAAVFLLHPVQTESVSYAAGLPEPLGTLWVLLGLLLYAALLTEKTRREQIKKGSLVILMFVLALFSKESMIVFLPLIFLYHFYSKKPFTRQPYLPILVAIGITYLVLRLVVFPAEKLNDGYIDPLFTRLITFVRMLWDYAVLVIYPVHLHFDREFVIYSSLLSVKGILAGLGLIGSLVLAGLSWGRKRILFFAIGWFFVAMVPYMGIIPTNATIFEHWLYLPLIGVAVLVAAMFDFMSKGRNKKIMAGLLIAMLILFGVRVIERNNDWATAEAFYVHELIYSPESARLHNAYGIVAAEKEDLETAIQEWAITVNLDNYFVEAWANLVRAYYLQGDTENLAGVCAQFAVVFPETAEELCGFYSSLDSDPSSS
jgi:protein O-mannosyl-transferase